MKLYYTSETIQSKISEAEKNELKDKVGKVIFDAIFSQIISSVYENRLSGSQSRRINRILNAIDESTTDFIEVKEEDFEFVKSAFTNEKASVSYRQARLFAALIELIEKSAKDAESDNV